MNPLHYKNTLIGIVTITLISRTIYRFLAWKKKKNAAPKQINEVITFSESTQLIQSQYSSLPMKVTPSTDRILYYLSQARHSLDICMYMLTSPQISFLIQSLHYRGVRIRFIVDAESAFMNKAETKRLYKQGIVVLRWMKTNNSNIMHHKFCLVDASTELNHEIVVPFVMTGSLNWTYQALNGNWESVVVTSNSKIVQLYTNEFEKLWQQFAPPHLLSLTQKF